MPRKQPAPKRHERSWGQGSVRQLASGRFQGIRPRQDDGSRPTRTFATREAAERWAAGTVEPDVTTLGAWLNRWLALRWPTLRPSSRRNYRRYVGACAPLATAPLAHPTADDWQALTNRLLERWARSHVKNWRQAMSGALNHAVERGLLERNPLRSVRLSKAIESPPKAWRRDEVARLLAAASGGRHEAWLWFSFGTGCRLGEARALEWPDVDLARREVAITKSLDNDTGAVGPTKTGRHRTVDLPDELVPILTQHRARQPASARLVFGKDGRVPYRPSTFRGWLDRLCLRAGVRRFSAHATRHSYVSLALEDGVPLPDIAHALGHASMQTTSTIYASYIGHGQRRAARAIGRVLAEARNGPPGPIGVELGADGVG